MNKPSSWSRSMIDLVQIFSWPAAFLYIIIDTNTKTIVTDTCILNTYRYISRLYFSIFSKMLCLCCGRLICFTLLFFGLVWFGLVSFSLLIVVVVSVKKGFTFEVTMGRRHFAHNKIAIAPARDHFSAQYCLIKNCSVLFILENIGQTLRQSTYYIMLELILCRIQ